MEKSESQYAIQPVNRKPITHKTHSNHCKYYIFSICINICSTQAPKRQKRKWIERKTERDKERSKEIEKE